MTTNTTSPQALILSLNQQVQWTVASAMSWEDKYDLIFNQNCSRKVFAAFSELNLRFDYYDPDADYEDDVLAFANALKARIEELAPLFEPFRTPV